MVEFLRLSRQAGLECWNFRIVGQPAWNSFTAEELRKVRQYLANGKNITTHFHALEGELGFFKEIKNACVVFCAYRDYPFSSGIVNWAGFFRRPVFAFRGELIGNRVERFNLGIAFDDKENFLYKMKTALRDYPKNGCWKNLRPKWLTYKKLHGKTNLRNILHRQLQETFAHA